jgi:hypothetical protein
VLAACTPPEVVDEVRGLRRHPGYVSGSRRSTPG